MTTSYKNAILLISCSILAGAVLSNSTPAAAEESVFYSQQTSNTYLGEEQTLLENPSSYQALQQKWRSQLVSDEYDTTVPEIVDYVQTLSAAAEDLYQKMDKDPNRTFLWPLEAGNTPSADLTTQFSKLQKLALAYGTKGTSFYKDPAILSAVEDGLDFMINKKRYDGKKYHGNWWDWQIGIPQKFVGILMVLGDELSSDKMQQYTTAISGYVPDPFKQLYTKPQGVFIDLAFIPNFVTSGANRSGTGHFTKGCC